MTNHLSQVKEFTEVFGHTLNLNPQIPVQPIAMMRVKLLQEEILELAVSILTEENFYSFCNQLTTMVAKAMDTHVENSARKRYDEHCVDILDALVDIQYILDGTILACGMQDVIYNAFNEVHKNNMSKTCDMATAKRSKEHYSNMGIDVLISEKLHNGMHILKCLHDVNGNIPAGKILKPLGFANVNLEKIIKDGKEKA